MNRAEIRTALDQFIVSEEFRVAALAGGWGVGKTHLWREYAHALMPLTQTAAPAPAPGDNALTLPITLNGIAYASLFGASSLGDLRARVAEGLVLAHTRAALVERYRARIESSLIAPLVPRAQSRWAGLPAWLRLVQRVRDDGLIGLIGASGYWFVRDVLVALDDLERCPNIELATVMGFVDELRSRGCKVVLITNRDKLDDEQQRLYWEKVVDCDLELAPDAEENSRIVFGGAFAPAAFAETARATLKALGCNNIRIHKRAAWLIREIAAQLRGLADDVRKQVVINATVYCWVLLEPTDRIPIDIVVEPDPERLWAELAEEDEDASGEAQTERKTAEKRWGLLAKKTDFSPTEVDQYLVSLISSGWCDRDAFIAALLKVNSEVDRRRARDRVHDTVFRTYTSNFNIVLGPYLEQGRAVLRGEIASLTVYDVATSLAQIRACGGETNDLAQLFIERRAEHLDLVAQVDDRGPIDDPTLDADVKRREQMYLSTRFTLDDVAHDIAARDSWSQDQIKFLANRSVDEYERWLRTAAPAKLRQQIKQLLDLREIRQDESYRIVSDRVAEALRRLARRSDFDRDRIARTYGVKLDTGS